MALLDKHNTFDDIDVLLAKYIAGQANAEESSLVEQWIAAAGTNEKYVEHLRLIWEESGRLSFTGVIDVRRAWKGLHQRILENPDAGKQSGPIRRRLGWIQVAAILVLMIGTGIGIYTWQETRNKVPAILHPFSGNQVRAYTLPDGSTVRLDPNSSLSYPLQFRPDRREVVLEGGGFFSVEPDPRRPFQVLVNGITVTVLGTSFSITSFSGRTEIVVKTGNIEVKGKIRSLILNAKEKLTVLGVDTGWVKGSDSVESSKTNQETGQRPPDSQLKTQKPGIQILPLVDSSSLAPALRSDPSLASKHPRPKFDERENKLREGQMKGIVSDLFTKNLINDYKSLVWFSLTDTALYINGIREPDTIQKVFKEKYNVTTDRGFFFGPFVVPKIARGMHADQRWLLQQEEFQ